MTNDWKSRLGIVYSTNPDYSYEQGKEKEPATLPPQQQNLIVSLDKKQRKGKSVTLIRGFVGKEDDLAALAKNSNQNSAWEDRPRMARSLSRGILC
jgi:translation initiation factor 1